MSDRSGHRQLPDAVVPDSCVLIDVLKGDLLSALLRLRLTIIVADAQIDELSREPIELVEVLTSAVRITSLSPDQVSRAAETRIRNSALSIQDGSALILAVDMNATLLTNERKLRKEADLAGVPAHGTLWLLDELIHHNTITKRTARASLQKMLDAGAYFPESEVRKRLAEWSA